MVDFWFDQASKTLVYPGVAPPHVAPFLDGLKQAPQFWAVPHNLRNAIILRHFNFPVAPIMDDYDFPIEPGRKPLPHQKVYANFSVMHPKSFNLGDPGCVDAETEYLSPTGWQRIDRYTGGAVAQYHADGHVDFVKPKEYVVAACNEMLHFTTSRGVDQMLSPEHRVVYLSKNGTLLKTTAQHVADKHAAQAQGWRGHFINAFTGGQKGIELSNAELRLMVAVIADAHFPYPTSNTCIISVKKPRKIERLQQLLEACGVGFKKRELEWETKKGYTRFTFKAPRHDKTFTAFYWGASNAQLCVVADEFRHWDGSAAIGARGCTFASTEKASADFVQYALVATGRTARVSRCRSNKLAPGIWTVTSRTKHVPLGLGPKSPVRTVVPSDGKKYCFEVPTNMLVLRRNGQVFVTGNTMKTLSTLWAADYLMRQFPKGTMRFLIVAPLTILDTVWAAAIFRNLAGRRTFKILIGDEAKRIKLLQQDADFYIVNPDGLKVGARARPKRELRGFSQALADRKDIRGIIIDEASGFKDHTTFRWWCFHKEFGDRPFLWQLTGTPTPNRPTDAYGLAKLVNNCFGKSFQGFQLESMIKVSLYKWVPQKDGYDKARRLLVPSVRFALEDVWDAPEMTVQRRKVELTDAQKTEMKRLKDELQIMTKAGPIDAANEAAARTKFIQISLGAVYDSQHNVHVVDASPRYKEIEDIVEGTQRKVLIFVSITSVIHAMLKHLVAAWKKEGLPYRCGFINGEVQASKRPALIRDFEADPNFRVMFADPQATAHGINAFVVADTVIWAAPTDKAELYIQGNARVRRPGQKYPTTCFQIVSNKLEEEIFDRLETNTGMQGLMLDAIRDGKF